MPSRMFLWIWWHCIVFQAELVLHETCRIGQLNIATSLYYYIYLNETKKIRGHEPHSDDCVNFCKRVRVIAYLTSAQRMLVMLFHFSNSQFHIFCWFVYFQIHVMTQVIRVCASHFSSPRLFDSNFLNYLVLFLVHLQDFS